MNDYVATIENNIVASQRRNFWDGNVIWRLLPLLTAFAAFSPLILSGLTNLNAQSFIYKENSSWLYNLLNPLFGNQTGQIFGFIPALLGAYGIYLIGRNLGAKIWAASIAASFYLAASAFGFAPNFLHSLDDAFFAGFSAIGAGFLVKTIATKKQVPMFLAFFFVTIATLFRPFSFWPQLAVFFGIILTTKIFEERPIYGLISSLCWGPGLFVASKFAQFYNNGLSFKSLQPIGQNMVLNLSDKLKSFGDFSSINWLEFGFFLLSALAFLIIFAVAIFALFIAFINNRKNFAKYSALAIFVLFAVFGCLGYGDVIAARYSLDTLLLGLIASLSAVKFDYLKNSLESLNFLKRK